MTVFSDIKLFPLKLDNSNLLAKGSVVVNEVVRFNFSVMNGSKGRFVSMPSEKSNKVDDDGKVKYFPIVSLLNKDMQDELNRLVLAQLDGEKPAAKPAPKATSSAPNTWGSKKKTEDIPF